MREKQPDFEVHINPLDIAKALAGMAVDHVTTMLSNLPKKPLSPVSEHFQDRGAEAMLADILDQEGEAYEQGQLFDEGV